VRQILKGSTNVSVDVYIIDSTDGTPELGVLFDATGMDLEYRRELAAVVNITEATLAALTTAHADGGFLEIGHGLYRLDVPDAAFATGVETVSIQGTVTGMIILPQTIQLVDFDPEDGVRLGLTALPNAAADAAGGLPISDLGGLELDDIPITSEFNARTILAADYFDPAVDNIAGSVGSVTGAVGSVAGNVDGNVTGSVGSNLELGPSEVLAQVNAALDTVISELSVAAPSATPTLRTGLMLLYMALRNRTDVFTSGTDALRIYNNAGTIIATKLLTDDGSDYSEAEMS